MRRLAVILGAISLASAQEPVHTDSLEAWDEAVNERLAGGAPDADAEELLDDLEYLRDHPINARTASLKDWSRIPGVTPLLAYRIHAFQRDRGLSRLEDLSSVEGIDGAQLNMIAPFVVFPSPVTGPDSFLKLRMRAQTELQERRGYREQRYRGGRAKAYGRFSMRTSVSPAVALDAGTTVEKDPGERVKDGFVSGFLGLSGEHWSVIAGDFATEAGHGMVLGRRIGRLSRGTVPGGIRDRLYGYSSADESRFLRGVAVRASFSDVSASLFISRKPVHGSMADDVFHPDLTGLFRTEPESVRRNIATEQILGGFTRVNITKRLELSLSGYVATYDVMTDLGRNRRPERRFAAIGLDLMLQTEFFSANGSLATEGSSNHLVSVAICAEPVSGMMFYGRNERNFGEYLGLMAHQRSPRPGYHTEVGAMVRITRDLISRGWVRVHHTYPTAGGLFDTESAVEALWEASFAASRTVELRVRIRGKEGPEIVAHNDAMGRSVRITNARQTSQQSIELALGKSSPIVSRTKLEYINTSAGFSGADKGFLISHRWRYSLPGAVLQAQWSFFVTDSWDARLYASESGVPGMVMARPLSGRGTRLLASAQWTALQGVIISASFGGEVMQDVRTIGTGFDATDGDERSTITVQIDVRF